MIKAGQYYRHFKGNLYYVIEIATHTETGEKMVVYRDTNYDQKVWVRPLEMFEEKVMNAEGKLVPRFAYHSNK